LLLERGWQGLMMDLRGESKNPRATVQREIICAENINLLFQKYRVSERFDLLSIDIDGNDFWVWREITARPRVVLIEYNANFPPDESRVIVYDPGFVFENTDYSGASLLALAKLGERKGYTLVYCESHGVNAFFVANEALPADFKPRPIAEIYRPPNYFGRGLRWPPDRFRQMIDPFEGWNEGYYQMMVW
jgi:hypothetical protein